MDIYSARLSKTDLGARPVPGSDRPIPRWPKPQIRQFFVEDRMVLQLMLPREALAELEEAGGEIEMQIVPEDFE